MKLWPILLMIILFSFSVHAFTTENNGIGLDLQMGESLHQDLGGIELRNMKSQQWVGNATTNNIRLCQGIYCLEQNNFNYTQPLVVGGISTSQFRLRIINSSNHVVGYWDGLGNINITGCLIYNGGTLGNCN